MFQRTIKNNIIIRNIYTNNILLYIIYYIYDFYKSTVETNF